MAECHCIYLTFRRASLSGQVKEMAQAGIRMIGIGALGYDASPEYNKPAATKCRKAGMDILSCTPEKLAEAMGAHHPRLKPAAS